MVDQFFTPTEVAKKLIAPFRRDNEECIADFAAGEGELLKVASERWPIARIVATDIDARIVRRLQGSQPSWNVGRCDFLNAKSRRASQLLRESIGQVSLAVINPPFSCRGNRRHVASINGVEIRCSRAMAFLINAVPYISKDGRIAAIMPAGCISSEKDSQAWSLLNSQFSIRAADFFGMRTFDGCAARTAIVVLRRSKRRRSIAIRAISELLNRIPVRIIRGAVPMHSATNGMAGPNWPFVHTTNLQHSKVTQLELSLQDLHRFALAPSVLLPRVGEPNKEKCALYLQNRRIVLSDCIFAIACASRADAECLHARLTDAWDVVAAAYGGTCARYLTTDNLHKLLSEFGCDVTEVEAVGWHACPNRT